MIINRIDLDGTALRAGFCRPAEVVLPVDREFCYTITIVQKSTMMFVAMSYQAATPLFQRSTTFPNPNEESTVMKLGINGLGRIGKLSLWHHVSRQFFSEIVVNLGRNVGAGIESIASSIEKDSTYGRLSMYLHGHKGGRVIENLDEARGSMTINGVPVTFLRKARNPKDIEWQANQVRLVVDSTGAFKDPTADPAEGRARCAATRRPARRRLSCPPRSRFRPKDWTCRRMP